MRHLMGRQTIQHLWVFLSAEFFFTGLGMSWQPQPRGPVTIEEFNAWFAKQEELTAALLQTLGVTWHPRLARAVFSPPVATLDGTVSSSRAKPGSHSQLHRIAARGTRLRNDSLRYPSATAATANVAVPAAAPFDAAGIRGCRPRGC